MYFFILFFISVGVVVKFSLICSLKEYCLISYIFLYEG